jgi:hypothetical protein
MSLPQLIGLQCVTCQKSISSIVDGAFCDACGNPMHRKCLGTVTQVQPNGCAKCGGDPSSSVAQEVLRDRAANDQTEADTKASASRAGKSSSRQQVRIPEPDNTFPFPISKVCPKCGSNNFTRVPPKSMVAFTKDRVCNRCHTRYTPPTPLWAAFVFILLGILFLGGSLGSFLMQDDSRIFPRIIGIVIGFSSLGLGIKSLTKPSEDQDPRQG